MANYTQLKDRRKLMGYVVKEADLVKDRATMVEILSENRSNSGFDYNKRFEWIYVNNPFGKAKAWIIWDDKKDLAVGFTGVFPRPVFVNGKQHLCWNCGDFSISKKYRALGVALKLRRAAKDGVDNGEVPFLYAHPNSRMEVIHLKVGHTKMALMHRYALPIRVNRKVGDVLGKNLLSRLASRPLNFILSMKFRSSAFLGIKGTLHNRVTVGAEHDELYRKMTEQFKVVADRGSTYLKWKFGSNPNRKYYQYDMHYKNHLVGSVFFMQEKDVVHLIDILIDDYDRYAAQLLQSFVNTVRKNFERKIVSVSFITQEFNPFLNEMKQIGFRKRNDATSGAISYANPEKEPEIAQAILDGKQWFMTVGDRDA